MARNRRLKTEESRFVEMFVGQAGGDARRAAALAGLPDSLGPELYAREDIRTAIAKRMVDLQRIDGGAFSPVEIWSFWRRVLADPGASLSLQVKVSELASKALGMFVDRKEVAVRVDERRAEFSIDLTKLSDSQLRDVLDALGPGVERLIDVEAEDEI